MYNDFGVEIHTPQFFKVPAEEHVVLIDATCLGLPQAATATAKCPGSRLVRWHARCFEVLQRSKHLTGPVKKLNVYL